MISYLCQLCRGYTGKILLLIFLGISSSLFAICIPHITSAFVDNVLKTKQIDKLYVFVFIVLGIAIFSVLADFISQWVAVKLQLRITYHETLSILKQISKSMPYEEIESIDSGYLSKRIETDINCLCTFALNASIQFLINFCYGIFALLYIFYIGITWGFVYLVFIAFYVIIYVILKKTLNVISYRLKETENRYFSAINKYITNISQIRIHGIISLFEKNLSDKFINMSQVMPVFVKFRFLFASSNKILGHFIVVFLFLLGGISVIDDGISIGQFLALNGYFSLGVTSVAFFLGMGQEFQFAKASYQRMSELNYSPDDSVDCHIYDKIQSPIDSISVKNLYFSYGNERQIFKNLSYDFHINHIYAVLGDNGTGKSTFLYLLLGLLKPSSGMIFINSTPYEKIDIDDCRISFFSFMEQLPAILPGTLFQNIQAYHSIENFDDVKFNKYSKTLLNEKMSNRLNTEISDDELSGGEKRKISFIRTICKKASVLIFDEPSAYVDQATSYLFKKIIKEESHGKIVIIVSHDLDFVDDLATNIIDLSKQNQTLV